MNNYMSFDPYSLPRNNFYVNIIFCLNGAGQEGRKGSCGILMMPEEISIGNAAQKGH